MEENREKIRKLIVEQLNDALQRKLDEVAPLVAGGGALAAGGTVLGIELTMAGWAALSAGLAAALGGAAWWMMSSDDEQERIASEVQRSAVDGAFLIYAGLKGMGTDEDEVRKMLSSKPATEIQVDYAKVLLIVDDYKQGGLIEWLRDDGMDTEAEDLILRMAQGR